MKNSLKLLFLITIIFLITISLAASCENQGRPRNTSALDEQARTEKNQRDLNSVQPAPKISWSLERDNLIKRFKLQNDRAVMFYMYLFIEGVSDPVGYYQVNKVSSVNSQLTNTMQAVDVIPNSGHYEFVTLPSPAEDGSYGTNGDAVFGFTPEDIYIEHNMKYVVSTVPLKFRNPVNKLSIISVENQNQLRKLMDKLNG